MRFKILAVIAATFLLIVIIPKPQVREDNPFRRDDEPLIIAHGGGNQEFPDNTLEAYFNAYSVNPGFMLEIDVNMTADGIIILSHDLTLDRKTNLQNALISEITYDDLVNDEIDFGYSNPIDGPNGYNVTGEFNRYTNWEGNTVTPLDVTYPSGVSARHPEKFLVTTLEEIFLHFPDNLMSVEIKQSGELGLEALEKVMDLMVEYDMIDQVVLGSFHREIVDQFVAYQESDYPNLMYAPQEDGVRLFYIMTRAYMSLFYPDKPATLAIPTSSGNLDLTTNQLINNAHRHNIAIHYWTINDPDTMRLLIERGADGLITDRPTLMQSILDETND